MLFCEQYFINILITTKNKLNFEFCSIKNVMKNFYFNSISLLTSIVIKLSI